MMSSVAIYARFQSPEIRLNSFRNWENINQFISKEQLLNNGFFHYNPDRDAVQCYYCGIIIGNWEKGDIVEVEHILHSPKCDLARGLFSENKIKDLMIRICDKVRVIGKKDRESSDILKRIKQINYLSSSSLSSSDDQSYYHKLNLDVYDEVG